MSTPDPEPKFAIPRLAKIKRQGLDHTHAARAENGLELPHLIPGKPQPEVLFNRAPAGIKFKAFVLHEYEKAKAAGLVYRPRKDQVLAIEGLLTASPEFFRPHAPGQAGEYTPESVQVLRERGLKFLHEQFGEHLIRVELQLDEFTPHIQFAFFPIDKRGRWSAKNCMPNYRLSALWDAWAAAMDGLGLSRGIQGSAGDHERVRNYYKASHQFENVNKEVASLIVIAPPKLNVPAAARLKDPQAYIDNLNKALADWGAAESLRIRQLVEPHVAGAVSTGLAMRRSKQDRKTAEKNAARVVELEKEVVKLRRELVVHRPITATMVADHLGHKGKVDQDRDVLEFLERAEGFSLDQAFGWLTAEFGPEAAAVAAAEHRRQEFVQVADQFGRPEFPKPDQIQASLDRQLAALAGDRYALVMCARGITKRELRKVSPRTGTKATWSRTQLVAAVPDLKCRSVDNDLWIVPVSESFKYVLLTDLKSPKSLEETGYMPCNILQVGPNAYEAVLRIPIEADPDEMAREIQTLIDSIGGGWGQIQPENPLCISGLRRPSPAGGQKVFDQSHFNVSLVEACDVDFREDLSFLRESRPPNPFDLGT